MEFVAVTNSLIFLLLGLLAVVLFAGIRLAYIHGGWNRHLVYCWTLIIHMQYTLFTPLFFYTNGKTILHGTDISEYYGVGTFFNLVAMIFFVAGYWLTGFDSKDKWNSAPAVQLNNPFKWISILFYFFYALIIVNMAIGGINVTQVYFGRESVGLGAQGATYYIQNFTNSLITLIILAYLYDVPKRRLMIWIVLSFFLFSILGFRFRILLTLFGLSFVYLYKNKIYMKQTILGVVLILCFMYLIMFSTENRRLLIDRDYDTIEYNPAKFDYYNFFDQSRGALADIAVYKLYDNPNKSAEHDYGISMFGYIFIRLIPRALLENKSDFYPPPQIKTTLAAYDAYWGKYTGEATLSVAGLYINFGWLGIVIGYFVWAILIRRYSNKVIVRDNLSLMKYIVVALITFQWVTRGYFPQVVDIAAYMFIPVWLLSKFFKKKVAKPKDTVNHIPGYQMQKSGV